MQNKGHAKIEMSKVSVRYMKYTLGPRPNIPHELPLVDLETVLVLLKYKAMIRNQFSAFQMIFKIAFSG